MRQYLLLLFLGLGVNHWANAQLAETPKNQWFGTASYYAQRFEGRKTASGAVFRHDSLTAAHKTLPLGTRVKVTNRENQQCIEVVINDRMAKRSPHLIDLSKAGARELGFIRQGFALVSIEVIPTLPKPDAQPEDIP